MLKGKATRALTNIVYSEIDNKSTANKYPINLTNSTKE